MTITNEEIALEVLLVFGPIRNINPAGEFVRFDWKLVWNYLRTRYPDKFERPETPYPDRDTHDMGVLQYIWQANIKGAP